MAFRSGTDRWLMVFVAVLIVWNIDSATCQWTLDDFAQEFCTSIAREASVTCDCVDTEIIPGQGKDLCGYKTALGPGLQVDSSTFNAWEGDNLIPDTNILIKNECDARKVSTNNIGCVATGAQTITASTTTSYTVGLGIKVTLGFSVPGLVDEKTELSFSFDHTASTENGNSVTASNNCGPPWFGQTAGTCSIYTETYNSYSLGGGRTFTYDAVVSGGVQMSFSNPIDAQAVVEQGKKGGEHYYWYFPISDMVNYGKSSVSKGDIANMKQFDYPKSGSGTVKFHGSGDIHGRFLDLATVCHTTKCPE